VRRGVQKRATGTAGAADQILGQRLKILTVVIVFFADQIHQPSPSPGEMPITWQPSRSARMVTARIAGFKPGTSPPAVRIPITPFFAFTLPLIVDLDFGGTFTTPFSRTSRDCASHPIRPQADFTARSIYKAILPENRTAL